ncbi:MAG: aminodeoxychorismate/anthranilate synthase component II [Rhizobacter sp.]|nr:aminodeoxychorismate/anthranilate synthase component II [Bacteriovorax sp.]
MSDKILIIDFEDSFTYNISNIIFPFEKNCKVITHQEFFRNFETFISSSSKMAIILGPGPGHPDQYENYFLSVKKLLDYKNIYIMGICLGHQIMGRVSGKEILKSHNQMHGQTVEVEFKGKTEIVQRYNSLAVFEQNIEKDICIYDNGISYQFHPESIGTCNNYIFFEDLLAFLKKK